MNQHQPIPNLVGYYASDDGILSAAKNGAPLQAEGRRGISAMVKTRHGRLNAHTLLTVTLGPAAASAWAREYDRQRRAEWLRFRRDNPTSEANTWPPLTEEETDWLDEYDAAKETPSA